VENGALIEVLYFARVAEHTGTRHETVPLATPTPAGEWLQSLVDRFPSLAPASHLKLAINQQHALASDLIRPGDEVAVFDPVTGG